MSPPRVRFAPSPTGYLHIGGARSALFNWLWARKLGGTFVLRIEDTDKERNTKESVQAILDSMSWLGLDWDEGPFFQTQRLELYAEHAERLIRTGHAYRDYTTKDELEALRAAHVAAGHARETFRYPGLWRDKTSKDWPSSGTYTVRFKSPRTGSTGWVDLVKGRIDVPNDAQQDFVLLRQDGMPLYNFGCVVDDLTMNISLVGRGDDHVVNTPPQILLFQALGAPVPEFAHMPMILAPNGEKLSKRHAAVSVLEYRDNGYLPDAVLNYLARLGWSHGDQEIFSRDELVEKFDWKSVGANAGKYDAKKFLHVQTEHLRRTSNEALATLLEGRGVRGENVAAAIATVKTRATTLVEMADLIDFYLREPPVMDDTAAKKFLTPSLSSVLSDLATLLSPLTTFDRTILEQTVTGWLGEAGKTMKDIGQPVRVALTGRTQSPQLFEVMEVLGKDVTLARLGRAARIARGEG